MPIYYVSETALDFWRWKASTLSSMERPKTIRNCLLSRKPTPANEAINGCTHFRHPDSPVRVMVGDKKHAHSTNQVRHTVCTRKLPPHAFWKLNDRCYVASPEFVFVTLSKNLDVIGLSMLGCELTGKYAMRAEDERGFSACEPLASASSISHLIGNSKGFPGIKNARSACNNIVENAASPMEACVALLLTLPRRLGGYGLPKPKLNCQLNLSAQQRMELKRESITVDMLWPKSKLAIEYESTAWHHGDSKFIQDSIRRNDIRSLGYDVTTITIDEYKSTSKMNNIAKTIASKLGKHAHLSHIDPCRQSELRTRMRQCLTGPDFYY